MKHAAIGLIAAALLFALTAVAIEQVTEKYPSGKIKAKYRVDSQKRRTGVYVEYYENSSIKMRAGYQGGRLSGRYTTFHPNKRPHVTATYRRGKLHGLYTEKTDKSKLYLFGRYKDGKRTGRFVIYVDPAAPRVQVWKNGVIQSVGGSAAIYPRSIETIRKDLAAIYAAKVETQPGDAQGPKRAAALKRLNAFRYLCGVPHDITLNDEYNRLADAGSNLCQRVGQMNHTPKNPGMPVDEYKFGYRGTSGSNLFMGSSLDLPRCVDGWMDDSNPGNISRVGHRMWMLNPPLQQIGVGRSQDAKYAALYVLGRKRRDKPDLLFHAYPAAGYMPIEYFRSSIAWSIAYNPKKYAVGKAGEKRVEIFRLDDAFVPQGGPLPLDYHNVAPDQLGSYKPLIFRPKNLKVSHGARYWVRTSGIEPKSKKTPALSYVVEFVDLKRAQAAK